MQGLQQEHIKQLNEHIVYHSIARAINSLLKYVCMLPFLLLADHHIVLTGKHCWLKITSRQPSILETRENTEPYLDYSLSV